MFVPELWRFFNWLEIRAARKDDIDRVLRIAAAYAGLRPRDPMAWVEWTWWAWRYRDEEEGGRILVEGLTKNPGSKLIEDSYAWHLVSIFDLSGDTALLANARHLHEIHREDEPSWPLPYIGLMNVAIREEKWTECISLAHKARHRISATEEDFTGVSAIGSIAALLVQVPGGEQVAIDILKDAVGSHPELWDLQLLLSVLIEHTDPVGAKACVDAARPFLADKWLESRLEDDRAEVARKRARVDDLRT